MGSEVCRAELARLPGSDGPATDACGPEGPRHSEADTQRVQTAVTNGPGDSRGLTVRRRETFGGSTIVEVELTVNGVTPSCTFDLATNTSTCKRDGGAGRTAYRVPPHSYRSATMGLTRVARQAGRPHAASATSVRSAAAPTNVAGSFGATP